MERLYWAILYLCLNFGETRSLLDIADSLDMHYSLAWKRLGRLEQLDGRIHVERQRQGMQIRYNAEGLPESWRIQVRQSGQRLGVITISRTALYRKQYEEIGS
jgi:hypothetical protein